MDGVRLAHHVRHRWPPVKIIVASGLIDTLLADLPTDTVFMPKPYESLKLWHALAHLTDQGPANPSTQRPAA